MLYYSRIKRLHGSVLISLGLCKVRTPTVDMFFYFIYFFLILFWYNTQLSYYDAPNNASIMCNPICSVYGRGVKTSLFVSESRGKSVLHKKVVNLKSATVFFKKLKGKLRAWSGPEPAQIVSFRSQRCNLWALCFLMHTRQ